MGTPLSPWRARVHEILSDGEWHDLEQVVRDAMRLVPPGKAYRQAERNRKRQHPGPRTRGDEGTAIHSGQRQLVMSSVHAAVRRGVLERRSFGSAVLLRDPNQTGSSTPVPPALPDVEAFAEVLHRQVRFWKRAYGLLPKGELRDVMLDGDPLREVVEVLRQRGRYVAPDQEEGS